ncbi:hypothetical protein [Schaalia sp. 19OD2882]|uniref:hypothetical protein n=1 Tax=Schaalia sp. 19OD2882 TaxID=2794089 RepID=UPI001C1EAABF|nr:hypothetical protein [Schaalia sp. 19OD2882]
MGGAPDDTVSTRASAVRAGITVGLSAVFAAVLVLAVTGVMVMRSGQGDNAMSASTAPTPDGPASTPPPATSDSVSTQVTGPLLDPDWSEGGHREWSIPAQDDTAFLARGNFLLTIDPAEPKSTLKGWDISGSRPRLLWATEQLLSSSSWDDEKTRAVAFGNHVILGGQTVNITNGWVTTSPWGDAGIKVVTDDTLVTDDHKGTLRGWNPALEPTWSATIPITSTYSSNRFDPLLAEGHAYVGFLPFASATAPFILEVDTGTITLVSGPGTGHLATSESTMYFQRLVDGWSLVDTSSKPFTVFITDPRGKVEQSYSINVKDWRDIDPLMNENVPPSKPAWKDLQTEFDSSGFDVEVVFDPEKCDTVTVDRMTALNAPDGAFLDLDKKPCSLAHPRLTGDSTLLAFTTDPSAYSSSFRTLTALLEVSTGRFVDYDLGAGIQGAGTAQIARSNLLVVKSSDNEIVGIGASAHP